mgnify:CR=1 FL=1
MAFRKKHSDTITLLTKIFSFIPTLLLLFLIFGFSAQDGESSGSLSFQISLFLVKLASPLLPAAMSEEVLFERAEFIHYFVRKAAHMTEYFLLALSLQLPLYEQIMEKAPDSLHTLIASGDVYIRASKPLQKIPEADVVYFDAFAPEKQPEMWEQSLFDYLYQILNEGGILTTYCAKGIVRRMLQAAGFMVERLPGPPGGKREILRATKNNTSTR